MAYADVILDADNAGLASLSFSNIPGVPLESFVQQPDGSIAVTVRADDGTEHSVVTFENEYHALAGAETEKDGSTILYSTDGETWSETSPVFAAVGVHTVWAYAANPNYEDTEPVTGTVTIRENEAIRYKLEPAELSDAFASYPQELQDRYEDADTLAAELKAALTEQKITGSHSAINDVKLLFSLDDGDTWSVAEKDNFPSTGVRMVFPCPERINRFGYRFALAHMVIEPLNTGKTVGDVEWVDISLTDEGIVVVADCLSPFALGWKELSVGGGGAAAYPVALNRVEHGVVGLSQSSAAKGTRVSFRVEPNAGYRVEAADRAQVATMLTRFCKQFPG